MQKKFPCGPCQLRICPLDHRCMKELLPRVVFVAAVELLNNDSPSAIPNPTLPLRKAS